MPSEKIHVRTTVNGEATDFLCEANQSLLEVLRDILFMTGTKEGCNDGNCGACTVNLDGRIVDSCLVLGVEAEGSTVLTIEGVASPEGLHPIQQAFLENAALQCGVCTPGFIVASKALLEREPNPSEYRVRHWLAGNLCRCTGYDKIVRAVVDAAQHHGREELMTTVEERNYKVIGTRPIRHDGADKVTGRAIYGIDFHLTGELWGKILRSPHAHANIVRIDTSKAEALPGVRAVVTGRDLPIAADMELDDGETSINTMHLSNNVMAHRKALYRGHAVAAVAADNQHIAEEAANLIEVEYEVLPPALLGRDAMKKDAPLVHPEQTTRTMSYRFDPGKDTGEKSNVASRTELRLGDIEEGFKQADVIVEREFSTNWVHQGYIEAQNATVLWNTDDTIQVWNSSQGTFNQRQLMAEILKHPVSQIRITPLEIGGGFGGKIPVYLEVPAAALSKKSGRPVKMMMSRTEVFEGTGPASGSQMMCKMGATKDGKIVAAYAELIFEAGAFPGSAVGAGAQGMFTSYTIDNILIYGYDVTVNKPKSAAYRSPGTPQACFAAECVVDELAEKVGIDPLEFRMINAAKEGDRRADGVQHPVMGNLECMQSLKDSEHYKSDLGGPNRGRGVASGYWGNAGMPASCAVSINPTAPSAWPRAPWTLAVPACPSP